MRGKSVDNLEEQIGRMRSQLASIRRGYRDPATGPSREAAEDLRATIEELYVAEEELRLEHEELLRARAEADDQRRRYEELFQLAPDAYVVTNALGVVREANRAAAGLLGRNEVELLGQPMIDVFVEGQSEDEVEGDDRVPLERALGAMRAGYGQWDYTSPSGGRDIAVRYECAPLTDAGGVVGAIVALGDVTGRRQLERDLRRRADEDPLTGLHNRRS